MTPGPTKTTRTPNGASPPGRDCRSRPVIEVWPDSPAGEAAHNFALSLALNERLRWSAHRSSRSSCKTGALPAELRPRVYLRKPPTKTLHTAPAANNSTAPNRWRRDARRGHERFHWTECRRRPDDGGVVQTSPSSRQPSPSGRSRPTSRHVCRSPASSSTKVCRARAQHPAGARRGVHRTPPGDPQASLHRVVPRRVADAICVRRTTSDVTI